MNEPNMKARDGFSLVEVVVSMVLLAFVVSSLAVLTTKTAQRSIDMANSSARQAFSLQETNRIAALPYTSLAAAVGCDTLTSGNLRYRHCVTATSASTYKQLMIIITPLHAGTFADTTIIRRSASTTSNPLNM